MWGLAFYFYNNQRTLTLTLVGHFLMVWESVRFHSLRQGLIMLSSLAPNSKWPGLHLPVTGVCHLNEVP